MPLTLADHARYLDRELSRGMLQAFLALPPEYWTQRTPPRPRTRRERLAHWWTQHRPHWHLGPCPYGPDVD